jgi:hypothetical protein
LRINAISAAWRRPRAIAFTKDFFGGGLDVGLASSKWLFDPERKEL